MTQGKEPEEQIVTLEREIKFFADSLPYWAQYLSVNILSGNSVAQAEIDAAYSYLLEDGGLQEKSKRPSLNIDCSCYTSCAHKPDLALSEIKDVEGVNALVEGQSITFSPAVTVIYGINGSGKTGYIRILKKAFFSKAGEQILPNVHIAGGHKKVSANFVFRSSGKPFTLGYPDDADQIEFEQFAVFDVKSVSIHLNNKNQFEFRPAGLNFFSELTKAYKRIEDRIQAEIEIRSVPKDYAGVFDGESEIKTFLKTLSARTNVEDLKKHGPLTEEEKQKKNALEEEKARLLTLKKDKEIEELNNIKKLIENLELSINGNNELLCKKTLSEVNALIRDCAAKEALAKKEGVEGFTTDVLKHIGGAEWKAFIEEFKGSNLLRIQGVKSPISSFNLKNDNQELIGDLTR